MTDLLEGHRYNIQHVIVMGDGGTYLSVRDVNREGGRKMDRRWIHGALFTPQYICGVRSFMNFVKERFSESEKILCPCESCLNYKSLEQNEVERHLLLNGMSSTYTRWIDHGEDRNIHVLEELEVVEDANVDSYVPEHTNDGCGLEEMLGELVRSEQHRNEARPEDGNEGAASHFKQLIEDAKHGKIMRERRFQSKSIAAFSIGPQAAKDVCLKKRSEEAQWHKLKRKHNEKEMTHPARWKGMGRF
ncbi:unnamed protein product [Miscanthus lutarioriparius]|uniref:Transposase-associated domain-containing protein n=1 Tax=Miscanthus lutarioriparius TaxID=422564 RepID=A0A811MVP6_9POAL|nr:unnamed protein product [Miscanthus lutarioriparius]